MLPPLVCPRARQRRALHAATAVLLLCAAGACASRAPAAAQPSASMEREMPVPGASGVAGAPAADRLLERRASMRVEVESPSEAAARALAIVSAAGGYAQSQSAAGERSAHLVLRVPAPRLDATLDSIAQLGVVRTRTVSATDVTEEAVDLEARLGAMRATRDRLRQLLERAATVADVVAVERELARVQAELDAREARLRVLRGSVELAEVTLDVDRRLVLGPLGLLVKGAATLLGKLFVLRD